MPAMDSEQSFARTEKKLLVPEGTAVCKLSAAAAGFSLWLRKIAQLHPANRLKTDGFKSGTGFAL
jgi:hypothetical protein